MLFAQMSSRQTTCMCCAKALRDACRRGSVAQLEELMDDLEEPPSGDLLFDALSADTPAGVLRSLCWGRADLTARNKNGLTALELSRELSCSEAEHILSLFTRMESCLGLFKTGLFEAVLRESAEVILMCTPEDAREEGMCHAVIAESLLNLGRLHESVVATQRALERDPDLISARRTLAKASEQLAMAEQNEKEARMQTEREMRERKLAREEAEVKADAACKELLLREECGENNAAPSAFPLSTSKLSKRARKRRRQRQKKKNKICEGAAKTKTAEIMEDDPIQPQKTSFVEPSAASILLHPRSKSNLPLVIHSGGSDMSLLAVDRALQNLDSPSRSREVCRRDMMRLKWGDSSSMRTTHDV